MAAVCSSEMEKIVTHSYFRYWGKALPCSPQKNDRLNDRFHLLPFHSLDVAACGRRLLALPSFSLKSLAQELQWPQAQVDALFVFFLALHDLGKFARVFQGLVPHLSPDLVEPDEDKVYSKRHDTLGWWLWRKFIEDQCLPPELPRAESEFWQVWMRSVTGHHGKPPLEVEDGGHFRADASDYFLRADRNAAHLFMQELAELFLAKHLPLPIPQKEQLAIIKKHAWHLAGLSVLADWLGSSQSYFPYRSAPLTLQAYWAMAQQQAQQAVTNAGLQSGAVRSWSQPTELFGYLQEPTPLQQYAATVELDDRPQLFLLEDVTGAGKTEAALILTQRLMQAGRAHGLYFALPSMATANQMYQRVGQVYRQLYENTAQPSLVLAHGARQLLEEFRQSVIQTGEQTADVNYQPDEATASAQCNGWLADNRKKALLAEVGVGTLDQALLAVLPARHQSLRLLGLAGKVLLVDEVHSFDEYMLSLLRTLLTAHARQGGSVILLSATLSLDERDKLLAAYRRGLGITQYEGLADERYPLAVQAGQHLKTHACATRPQVRRQVQIQMLHQEEDAIDWIVKQANQGHCIAWIRNTVDDARRAYQALVQHMPDEHVLLFHSRYAMGDRLDIEADVLQRFGKHSQGAQRVGRVLIGTQVLEQSLDFDVDAMISDLAPIDLLIQRAGRLQRHARQANGDPAADGEEQRLPPVLHVLTPEPVDAPVADWYASMFPKAAYVYPDAGKLWLGARALQQAGCIVTPGEAGQSGAVRELVEAVYGADIYAVPECLQKASTQQIGQDLAMQSQARFNALQLDKGYCIDSSARWYEDHQVPTRLGDETLTLYLAVQRNGALGPLRDEALHAWEQSAVRVRATLAKSLTMQWQRQFDAAIAALRNQYRLLEEPAFILPLLESEDGSLTAKVVDHRGRERTLHYNLRDGLSW